jgi:anti-sigma regulatory factor (Ser/Thr protein kinase)
MPRSISIPMTDQTRVGEARRLALNQVQRLGFGATEAGNLAIVVTEAANNLLKHAQEGILLFHHLEEGDMKGMEILALDKGPGFADVNRCLADGHSTAGSSGHGLGAIVRLSQLFEIYSLPGKGTALVAHLWAQASFRPASRLDVGAVCLPKHERDSCGDVWAIQNQPDRASILLADGLGHGPMAAAAADEAARIFALHPGQPPAQLLKTAHGPLQATRGASVAVVEFSFAQGVVHYAGVGNISGAILNGTIQRSMVSHNGTLGHEIRRVQQFSYPWPPDGRLIMHSDGLVSRWSLDPYPGLLLRHPTLIAGILYRDFQRGRDDVTVVVARERG